MQEIGICMIYKMCTTVQTHTAVHLLVFNDQLVI